MGKRVEIVEVQAPQSVGSKLHPQCLPGGGRAGEMAGRWSAEDLDAEDAGLKLSQCLRCLARPSFNVEG